MSRAIIIRLHNKMRIHFIRAPKGAAARAAFTLIELLIVIAIIAVLALIAIPNFLEAQTRARLVKGLADMRIVSSALEAYAMDNGRYPPPQTNQGWFFARVRLTTPTAYLMGDVAFIDPFGAPLSENLETGNFVLRRAPAFIRYYVFDATGDNTSDNETLPAFYALAGNGPDRERFAHVGAAISRSDLVEDDFLMMLNQIYDPTNGSVSMGETLRFGCSTPVGAQRLAHIVSACR